MNSEPLWEMETSWFTRPESEVVNGTFTYKSWKDFLEYKPYKLWKPYILSSWSWKLLDPTDLLQAKKPRPPTEKTTMDCKQILRQTPSDYDTERVKEPPKPPVDMLQIVFISPDRFSGLHRVEIRVERADEEAVRDWLKRHLPTFWKL